MGVEHETIVVCRGRALLCPLDPDMADVLFIGRSRTPPLQSAIIFHTDKSAFNACYFNACSISAMMSFAFSMPTDKRIRSGATPASISCSSVN